MSGEPKHSIQRIIKDLTNDDERIQITGYVKDITPNKSFVLDDRTGEITVVIVNVDFPHKVGDLVNVFGDLNFKPSGEKIVIAEFVQEMQGLNFDYYKRLYELKKDYNL